MPLAPLTTYTVTGVYVHSRPFHWCVRSLPSLSLVCTFTPVPFAGVYVHSRPFRWCVRSLPSLSLVCTFTPVPFAGMYVHSRPFRWCLRSLQSLSLHRSWPAVDPPGADTHPPYPSLFPHVRQRVPHDVIVAIAPSGSSWGNGVCWGQPCWPGSYSVCLILLFSDCPLPATQRLCPSWGSSPEPVPRTSRLASLRDYTFTSSLSSLDTSITRTLHLRSDFIQWTVANRWRI